MAEMPASVHNPLVNNSSTSIAEHKSEKMLHNNIKFVDSNTFYGCYYGHPIEDLTTVCEQLQLNGCTARIFLVGDSSLDNKYWFGTGWTEACNRYERILSPPRMKQGCHCRFRTPVFLPKLLTGILACVNAVKKNY